MNKAGIGELRNLSREELDQKRQALEKDLFELRQKKAGGQLDKPHAFRLLRRQIARINTIKRESRHGQPGNA